MSATTPTLEQLRAQAAEFEQQMQQQQQQVDEASRQTVLLLDGQTAQTVTARALQSAQLVAVRQEEIETLTAGVHSLEQEIASLQHVRKAQVADHTTILVENDHMGGIVISVAEEVSRVIDDLNQLVRTSQVTLGNLREQHIRLQPVLTIFELQAAVLIAAPQHPDLGHTQLDVSAARTAGS